MVRRRRVDTMEENRTKLIAAGRAAFARSGFAAASMDDITASVGLTRGALYHNFGDKRGLFAAVVAQVDAEMASRAQTVGSAAGSLWDGLLAEGEAYIGMALDAEVRQIVLRDGPAILGDPSRWPSQNACLAVTRQTVAQLIADGVIKPVDVEAAAGLLNSTAMSAALWVAASDAPETALPRAIEVFRHLAGGLIDRPPFDS